MRPEGTDADRPAGESAPGPVLALDLGERRIGVAVSDRGRRLARALLVFKRGARAEDFATISRLADEHGASLVLVGLPLTLAGRAGSRAAWAREYAADLAAHLWLPVRLWDESFSSQDAQAMLIEAGVGRRRRRERLDGAAAAFSLQAFLDAGSPEMGDGPA
ncbi:MAG: Holliday junction resolvase RuvX [Candidatus Promineifilaceae bacterium]